MGTAWLYMYRRRVSPDICQETEIREKTLEKSGLELRHRFAKPIGSTALYRLSQDFPGFFFHNIWLHEVNVFLTWCIVSSLQYALFTLVGREYDFTAVSHVQLTLSSYYLFLFFFFFLFAWNESLHNTLHKCEEDSGNKKRHDQIPKTKSAKYMYM